MKNILRVVIIFFIINSILMAEVIKLVGSSTILPIMRDMDSKYFHKNGITLSIKGGGSNAGIKCLLENECQIGMVSRALSEEEKSKGMKAHLIGYDGIAIIVNKNNPISKISTKSIQDIYSGRVNNWKELDGNNHTIFLLAKQEEQSTRVLFDEYFKIQKLREKTEYAGSNIENILIVALEEYSISYVSVGSAEHAINLGVDIKMLQLDGIEPIQEGKINVSYPFMRALNLVTYGEYDTDVQKIISVMTSDIGKEVLPDHSFVPKVEVSNVK